MLAGDSERSVFFSSFFKFKPVQDADTMQSHLLVWVEAKKGYKPSWETYIDTFWLCFRLHLLPLCLGRAQIWPEESFDLRESILWLRHLLDC